MSPQKSQSINSIAKAIHEHRRFLVVTHVRPDGDAGGSVLGLTSMLRRLKKVADPYCQDPLPPNLDFLPGAGSIRHVPPDPDRYDVAILVDCGELHRVGGSFEDPVSRTSLVVNIDHHINHAPFGHVHWVDSSASSTCEMLYDLSFSLPVPLDPEIATLLYTGVITDTGSFRFSNTNCRVMEIATDLVCAGANPSEIAQCVYDSGTAQRLHLLGRVLTTVDFHLDARLATAALSRAMFHETGTTAADSDGFINHLRSVHSVDMAILFREDTDGQTHVSMRSKGEVDVAAFARRFGGGGHRNAAAFRTMGKLDDIRREFTHKAMDYLR